MLSSAKLDTGAWFSIVMPSEYAVRLRPTLLVQVMVEYSVVPPNVTRVDKSPVVPLDSSVIMKSWTSVPPTKVPEKGTENKIYVHKWEIFIRKGGSAEDHPMTNITFNNRTTSYILNPSEEIQVA